MTGHKPVEKHPDELVEPAPEIQRPAIEIIPLSTSDTAINHAIAAFQDRLEEWECGDLSLSSLAPKIRSWAEALWERFMPPVWRGSPVRRPPILLRFVMDHPNVLGHYVRGRNDTGFRWELSVNPRHLRTRSEAQIAATVLHEELHCFEDMVGSAPRSPNGYHSSWLRKTAAEIGIPCTRYGAELGILDPSPFMTWARERGFKTEPLSPPLVAVSGIGAISPVPRPPKRVVWICDCADGNAVPVLVARRAELSAQCLRCGTAFRRRDSSAG